MVTQRITHKIVYGFVQFDSCLGAAGIDVVGIFYQLACGNEILVQTLSRAFIIVMPPGCRIPCMAIPVSVSK